MKKLNNLFFIVLTLLVTGVGTSYAQDFQGIATYQSARKARSIRFSGEGITPEMQKQLDEQMKKRDQKEFELKFNLSEATWKESESLGAGPSGATSSIQVMSFSTGGGNGVTYKNTAEDLLLKESDLFGKSFLISDKLNNREWVLTDETRKIGNYNAQKATFTRTVQRQSISFMNDEEQGEPEMRTDTITVEAWYTPEIPVSQGPADYWGLPGLILEVNDGTTTYLCTKVVLNPEEGVEIKKPRKGKKVTQEEYTALVQEKVKEMSKKYSGGSNGATFRIGGNQ